MRTVTRGNDRRNYYNTVTTTPAPTTLTLSSGNVEYAYNMATDYDDYSVITERNNNNKYNQATKDTIYEEYNLIGLEDDEATTKSTDVIRNNNNNNRHSTYSDNKKTTIPTTLTPLKITPKLTTQIVKTTTPFTTTKAIRYFLLLVFVAIFNCNYNYASSRIHF